VKCGTGVRGAGVTASKAAMAASKAAMAASKAAMAASKAAMAASKAAMAASAVLSEGREGQSSEKQRGCRGADHIRILLRFWDESRRFFPGLMNTRTQRTEALLSE